MNVMHYGLDMHGPLNHAWMSCTTVCVPADLKDDLVGEGHLFSYSTGHWSSRCIVHISDGRNVYRDSYYQ